MELSEAERRPPRLLRMLLAQLESPRPSLVYAIIGAFVVGALASTSVFERLDTPLASLIARHLPVPAPRGDVVVVDLQRWTPADGDPHARAEDRLRLSRILGVLGAREDWVVGLDVSLDTTTTAEADRALAETMKRLPLLVGAQRIELNHRDYVEIALDREFAETCSTGWITLVTPLEGPTSKYGGPRPTREYLAARVAALHQPDLAPPNAPLVLFAPSEAVADRWPVLPADSLLAHPGLIDVIDGPAVVLVGLAGAQGLERDGVVLATSSGLRAVPGVFVHALALDALLSGRLVVDGGPLHDVAATLLLLLVHLGLLRGLSAWRRRRGGRQALRSGLRLAVSLSLLSVSFGLLISLATGALVSIVALLVAPFLLLELPRAGSALVRRLRFAIHVRPRLGSAPDALITSVRAAFIEPWPGDRLTAALDAYEDLVYCLAVLALAVRGAPKEGQGTVRAEWHKPHTLGSLLACLSVLDPGAYEALQAWSGEGPAWADGWQGLSQGLFSRPVESDLPQTARAPSWSLFIALRNAIAHDTIAWWLDERLAGAAGRDLQERLLGILSTPAIRSRLSSHALMSPSERDKEVATGLHAAIVVSPGGVCQSAAPWLIWDLHAGPRAELFRYRGLARKRVRLQPGGERVRLAVFSRFGVGSGSTDRERTVPLPTILDSIPPDQRPE